MILFKEIAEGILEPEIEYDRYLSKGEIGFIELPTSLKGPCYTCPSTKRDFSYYGTFPTKVSICATYHDVDTPPFEYTTANYIIASNSNPNSMFSVSPFVKSFEHLSTYLQTVVGLNRDASIISLTIDDSDSPIDPFIPSTISAKTSDDISYILKGSGIDTVTEKMFYKFYHKDYYLKNTEISTIYGVSNIHLSLEKLGFVMINICGTGICYIIPIKEFTNMLQIDKVILKVYRESLVADSDPIFTIEARKIYEILEMCYCVPDILYLERRFYGRNLSYHLYIKMKNKHYSNSDEYTFECSYLEERMDACNFYDIISKAVK